MIEKRIINGEEILYDTDMGGAIHRVKEEPPISLPPEKIALNPAEEAKNVIKVPVSIPVSEAKPEEPKVEKKDVSVPSPSTALDKPPTKLPTPSNVTTGSKTNA